ncbi:hypothetical protein RMN57_03610 [Kitasatospora sp. CM 4170]|uniref:ABC transport system permease protein n=1 Tax=Kitasatospora aburaviensis TaxID=67265 RepID=A0ABW1F0A9_9ACTN|nr:hypothetical protein [Kitasatospora sp. CM 4170]WNM43855.1 hypothetical protein RMN57_03610 [Kitasatospora sp. CM 4170]
MTTPADTRTPRPAGARPTAAHRPAPWVRTRLRSGRVAALLMAALAFGTVLLAAAFPRALDRGTDDALHQFLRDRGPSWNNLLATSSHPYATSDPRADAADLDEVARKLESRPGTTFRYGGPGPVYGARADKPRPLANLDYARPGEVSPKLGLMYLPGITERVTLVAGSWPTGAGSLPAGQAGAGGPADPVPVALNRSAAATIGIHLGDILLGGESEADRVLARVTGLYNVNDPNDPYWADLGCFDHACAQGNPHVFFATDGLVSVEGMGRLAEWGVHTTDFWRLPVDTGALHARNLPETGREITGFLSGPTRGVLATSTGREDLTITSQLPVAFDQAVARQNAAAPLAAIGPAGLAGVGAVVLFLTAGLTADRRTAELRLLQARGGSRGGVLLRLIGEGAVTVLPAAAAATALALWLVRTPRWTEAVLAALAVTLIALLGFPVRAATFWSKPRRTGGARRLVGELLVLAVTAAAVLEVRRRGVAPAGQEPDVLLVAAPLLLAVTGGLALARLQPAVVGALARVAGRRPGLIGFLGLARAARGTGGRARPSLLPLIALTLAVTTAGFGATVLDAVDSTRVRAARGVVGGDAAVSTPTGVSLPPKFTEAAAAMPGVRLATSVWWESEVFLLGSDAGPVRVSALVVDPQAYAELSRSVGRGAFDPALLAGGAGGPDAPLPALFSTALGKQLGGDDYRLRLPSGWELKATVAGRIGATPALIGDDRKFVVLPSGPAVAQHAELGQPNLWFGVGDIDERQLKRVVRELAPPMAWQVSFGERQGTPLPAGASGSPSASASATASASPTATASASGAAAPPAGAGPNTGGDDAAEADAVPSGYLVRTSGTLAAEFAADPLQRSAGRLFWAAVIGAAGFALLAVLLTLVRTAPERAALLARLRTMGLRPRQGLALILAETVPQTLVAAVGGGLVALAAVALLGPAFDLSLLVGAEVPPGLEPAVLPVLRQVLGLVALVTAGVLAEALIAGRRHIATELRVGDQR